MIIRHEREALPADLSGETDVQGIELLPLLTEKEGAPNFSMRLFRLAPAGYTPFHTHPWEHEVFVIRGDGFVLGEEGSHPLEAGCAVYVPGGEKHRFLAGPNGMQFLCCVPQVRKD